MAASGDGGGREIGELAREEHQHGGGAKRRRLAAAREEGLAYFIAVALAQPAGIADERGGIDVRGAGDDPWTTVHLVRDQAGRFVAVTPLRRACRTSVDRKSTR